MTRPHSGPTTAESICWLTRGDSAYLHVGAPDARVIEVVGVPDSGMAGMNGCWWGESPSDSV